VWAPTRESIVRLAGSADAPVRDVTLRGLDLSATTTPLTAGGFAARFFAGAVEGVHTEGCVLADLHIHAVGGQGIRMDRLAGLRIEGCTVAESGAGGIYCTAGADAVLCNNRVHHVGRAYPSAVGIRTSGQRFDVRHNEVHDTPYSGIIASGRDGRFHANRIWNVMGELEDGAAIYVTFCRRMTLCGNHVSGILTRRGHAYYLDEQAVHCLVEGNVADNVAWPSHNHMAHDNRIANNLFRTDGDLKLTFPRCRDFVVKGNVLQAGGAITVERPAGAFDRFAGNLIHSATGVCQDAITEDYAIRSTGELTDHAENTFADPGLQRTDGCALACAPDGPAAMLGLEIPDVADAGCRAE
ncbi:MAG: right-handed parallel beta-helix repeat-containing protein, partial [Planctomycetota bacterium]